MFVVDGRISLLSVCPTQKLENPTRKTGISASDFLLFFLVGVLFLKSVQSFLEEIFWRSKQTFEFSGSCSEIRCAKLTNDSARSTREM